MFRYSFSSVLLLSVFFFTATLCQNQTSNESAEDETTTIKANASTTVEVQQPVNKDVPSSAEPPKKTVDNTETNEDVSEKDVSNEKNEVEKKNDNKSNEKDETSSQKDTSSEQPDISQKPAVETRGDTITANPGKGYAPAFVASVFLTCLSLVSVFV